MVVAISHKKLLEVSYERQFESSAQLRIPLSRMAALVWNRLHSEREDICEALLKEPVAGFRVRRQLHGLSKEDPSALPTGIRDLLQARLRKIDDALDRLMSGSYGNCCKCGKWIEDTKLDFDPAIEFCLGCWELQQEDERTDLPGVELGTLSPFETIWARTATVSIASSFSTPTRGMPSWKEDISLLSRWKRL